VVDWQTGRRKLQMSDRKRRHGSARPATPFPHQAWLSPRVQHDHHSLMADRHHSMIVDQNSGFIKAIGVWSVDPMNSFRVLRSTWQDPVIFLLSHANGPSQPYRVQNFRRWWAR